MKRFHMFGVCQKGPQYLTQNGKKTRTLWVDSKCINQDDPAERTAQVQLMRHVYSSASQVIVWLGAATENSNIVMEVVHRYLYEHEKTEKAVRGMANLDMDDDGWIYWDDYNGDSSETI